MILGVFCAGASAMEEIRKMQNDAGTRQEAASTLSTLVGYFDPQEPISDLLGNLPHWRQETVTYFVTFRLADSIPRAKLELWISEREDWIARHPPPHDPPTRYDYYRRFIERFQRWLDAGHGACVLAQPAVQKIVVDAILFFQDSRYVVRESVVMPNHVHAVVTPLAEYDLSKIVHSWKSFTANAINRELGRKGPLWQRESFDHIVRGPDQLDRIERYIHANPAGLAADSYSLHCVHK